jgi:hypothetical protein
VAGKDQGQTRRVREKGTGILGRGIIDWEWRFHREIPDIRGEPPNSKANWSNGFLPARHQAIVMSHQQPSQILRLAQAPVSTARPGRDRRKGDAKRDRNG